jgi:hypothetical protein
MEITKFIKSNIALISLGGVCILSAIVGGYGGYFLGNFYHPVDNNVDGKFSLNEDDYNDVKHEIDGEINIDDLSKIDTYKIFNYVWYKFCMVEDENFLQSYNFALSNSFVTNSQRTYTTWAKDGDLYFKEDASKGVTSGINLNVAYASRVYNFDVSKYNELLSPSSYEDQVDYYSTNSLKKTDDDNSAGIYISNEENKLKPKVHVVYDKKEEYDDAGYAEKYYLDYKIATSYLFTGDSVEKDEKLTLNLTDFNVEGIDGGNEETYFTGIKKVSSDKYSYVLSAVMNEEAAKYYKYFITTTNSAVNLPPTFNKIYTKLYLDDELNPLYGINYEDYTVTTVGLSIPTKALGLTTFHHGEKFVMPKLDEKLTYEIKL